MSVLDTQTCDKDSSCGRADAAHIVGLIEKECHASSLLCTKSRTFAQSGTHFSPHRDDETARITTHNFYKIALRT